MVMDVVVHTDFQGLKGSHAAAKPGNFYEYILTCLGYTRGNMPVGDVLRRIHGFEGTWLVASPIHWEATHQDARLDGRHTTLQLSTDMSLHCFDIFCEFVRHDGIQAHYHDPYTWLIEVSRCPDNQALPLTQLYDRSLLEGLKSMDNTSFWQRFFTECQMFFHHKDISASLPVNGVWVWGGGRFQPSSRMVVYDAVLAPLAKIISSSNISVASLDASSLKHAQSNQRKELANGLWIFDHMTNDRYAQILRAYSHQEIHWYWEDMTDISHQMSWVKRFWNDLYAN